MSIEKSFIKTFNWILTIFFPIECLGCNKENSYFCDDCLKQIPLHKTIEKFEHPLIYLDNVLTATDYKYQLIQKAIHLLKFRFIKELADPLTGLLINYINLINFDLAGFMIIPVPLNKKRLLERGFNQSELIAKIFAKHFNLVIRTDIVKRSKNTPHQVGLNKKARQTNIKDAFEICQTDFIQNKKIILIDDVVTTGSTLEEIAKTLKQSGAQKIWGLTIAKD